MLLDWNICFRLRPLTIQLASPLCQRLECRVGVLWMCQCPTSLLHVQQDLEAVPTGGLRDLPPIPFAEHQSQPWVASFG